MKKLIFVLCVMCVSLCACTSDDVLESSSSSASIDGDMAYLTVRITDVNSQTRASSSGYQNGTSLEYAVSDAYFYFYDEDGLFVSRAEVWGGGNETTDGTSIEFNGNTVIVLKGLTDVGFPRYMVTVLNRPNGFESYNANLYEPAATLAEMQEKLSVQDAEGIYNSTAYDETTGLTLPTNFVMSTSSYVDGTEDARVPYYFVTRLDDSDFYAEPIPNSEANAVDVYVERLAAKVEVGVSDALTSATINDGQNDHTAYLLKETIAGDPNVQDSEGDNYGEQDIYIEFLGWALNATARKSNIVKNITDLDANGVDGWTDWNDAENHRSYWGESFNYGLGDYYTYPTTNINPDTDLPNTDSDEADESTALNEYVKYTSLVDDNLHSLGFNQGYQEYCPENTNTYEVLMNKNSSAITSVLLKAQAWYVDDSGVAAPITLIRYRSTLWTESAFLNYVASELENYTGNTKYYYAVEGDEGTTTYIVLDGTYLEIANAGNGGINVAADADAIEDQTWYTLDDGTYTEVTDASTVSTAITTACTAFNTYWADEDGLSTINAFNDGLMYYSIPIEHLNNVTEENPLPSGQSILEAQYGVVRNHWYRLTINSLSDLGKGIYEETEVIVPDPEDPTYYYVGADINILSWQKVSQSDIDL